MNEKTPKLDIVSRLEGWVDPFFTEDKLCRDLLDAVGEIERLRELWKGGLTTIKNLTEDSLRVRAERDAAFDQIEILQSDVEALMDKRGVTNTQLQQELNARIAMCDMRSEKIIELTAERDEARRMYCNSMSTVTATYVNSMRKTPEQLAKEMNWNCFKENNND